MNTIFLIILSFFAVIGFIDTVLTFIDTFSYLKYDCIKSVSLNVKLTGNIDNVPFLLNSFIISSRKISLKDNITSVVINADETDADTYNEIREFCLENNDISVL